MHKRDGLSATHEMYLKIIYQLRESGDPARVGQMAKGLGVHPSTVSAVVGTLAKMALVTHDRYGVVKLTEIGERLAGCVVRRFETLRRFFTEVLGLDPDSAEVEACEIEHAINVATIARIDRLIEELSRIGYRQSAEPPPPLAELCEDCVLAGECRAAQSIPQDQ
jgi:DtxR family Mn-dependent transcriptional regulator